MPEFPSPERIIAELNDLQPYIKVGDPHPRRGEMEAGDWIADFAKQWSLGDVKKHPMPRTNRFEKFFTDESTELANVTIDIGEGDEEILYLHGHRDVVPPSSYQNKSIAIMQDATRENIYTGLGCHDMLAGVASILTALRKIKVARHRRIRAVIVFGEENDSEGTHAAFDSRNNLFEFDGKRFALSTEISVGTTLNDPYHLIVGRPGRIALNATIYGEAMHAGSVGPDVWHLLTHRRASKVRVALEEMQLQRHPHDTRDLMRGSTAIGNYAARKVGGLSTTSAEDMEINIHYSHPEQGMKQLFPLVQKRIAEVLGDENFELLPPKRDMPWTEPWLEELDNPGYRFPHIIQQIAKQVPAGIKQSSKVPFRTGKGVADEGIIAKHNIPVVCIPPCGEGEHTNREAVDIRCIHEFQVPIILEAAKHPHLLNGEYS